MLKNFPRGTLGAHRAYISGPQLKKNEQVKAEGLLLLGQDQDQYRRVCVCVCTHTLQDWGGLSKQAEGERKAGCAALLSLLRVRQVFSYKTAPQTKLQITQNSCLERSKHSQDPGRWVEKVTPRWRSRSEATFPWMSPAPQCREESQQRARAGVERELQLFGNKALEIWPTTFALMIPVIRREGVILLYFYVFFPNSLVRGKWICSSLVFYFEW